MRRAPFAYFGGHEVIATIFEYCPGFMPEGLNISVNGGDEDWAMEIPPEWVQGGVPCGVARLIECYEARFGGSAEFPAVRKYDHPTKLDWQLWVGSHS